MEKNQGLQLNIEFIRADSSRSIMAEGFAELLRPEVFWAVREAASLLAEITARDQSDLLNPPENERQKRIAELKKELALLESSRIDS